MEVKTHGLAHFKKMTNWMDIVVIAVKVKNTSSVSLETHFYIF